MANVVQGKLQTQFLFSTKTWPYETRKYLDEKVQQLAKKLQVKGSFAIIPYLHGGCASSIGFIPRHSFIGINIGFFKCIPKPEQEFILAHELSHLKHKDSLMSMLVTGLSFIVTCIGLSILFPTLSVFSLSICALSVSANFFSIYSGLPFMVIAFNPATAFAGIVDCIITPIFAKKQEVKADTAAITVCSDDAKRGALRFFNNCRHLNIFCRNEANLSYIPALWRRFQFSKEGNNRLDFVHPSLEARIKYLKPLVPPSTIKDNIKDFYYSAYFWVKFVLFSLQSYK